MPRLRFTTLLLLGALTVSSAGSASPAVYKPRIHRVYPGQTLGMIAKRYRVSVEALRHANGLDTSTRIKPKQRLFIPGKHDKDGNLARQIWSEARNEPEGGAGKKIAARHRSEPARTEPKKPARDTKSTGGTPAKSGAAKQATAPRYAKKPRRAGFVTITSLMGAFRGRALTKNGRISPAAKKGLTAVLASWRTGAREEIDERLIRMLVRVSDHFGGRPIRIVSGYRPYSPRQYTAHSRHNLGLAADFSVVGVPNTVLRDYCRTLPKVGVGYYPNSSFVHLDVRDVPTYWIDYSGPGERPRYANAEGRDPGKTIPANVESRSPYESDRRKPSGLHDGPLSSPTNGMGASGNGSPYTHASSY